MARCMNCGKEIGEERVCPNCGVAVVERTPKGNSVYDANARADITSTYTARAEKSNKSATVWSIVALLLFYPVGVFVMWALAKTWPKGIKIGITVVGAIMFVVSYCVPFFLNR